MSDSSNNSINQVNNYYLNLIAARDLDDIHILMVRIDGQLDIIYRSFRRKFQMEHLYHILIYCKKIKGIV